MWPCEWPVCILGAEWNSGRVWMWAYGVPPAHFPLTVIHHAARPFLPNSVLLFLQLDTLSSSSCWIPAIQCRQSAAALGAHHRRRVSGRYGFINHRLLGNIQSLYGRCVLSYLLGHLNCLVSMKVKAIVMWLYIHYVVVVSVIMELICLFLWYCSSRYIDYRCII